MEKIVINYKNNFYSVYLQDTHYCGNCLRCRKSDILAHYIVDEVINANKMTVISPRSPLFGAIKKIALEEAGNGLCPTCLLESSEN